MAFINRELREAIRRRAGGRCEYCGLPEAYSHEPFWIDHIIAEQHQGPTAAENLAYCCMRCNRHKGPNLAGRDPLSGNRAFLYSPRTDLWSEHFLWAGPELAGLTPIGRATIAVLQINHPARLAARAALMAEGVYDASPPAPNA